MWKLKEWKEKKEKQELTVGQAACIWKEMPKVKAKCRAWNSSRKWGFSWKWKLKIAKDLFRGGKNRQAYFFTMKIKMMNLWVQIEGTKLIFIMNFSLLHFFKFAPRIPQVAQILVSTFKIFQGSMPPNLPRNFLFFFSLAIPGSANAVSMVPVIKRGPWFHRPWCPYAVKAYKMGFSLS